MLSNSIKSIRKRAKETQQEMADRLGVSKRTVASWESGDRMPSYEILLLLSTVYGVTTDFLLGRESSHETATEELPVTMAAHASTEMTPELEARIREIAREVMLKYGHIRTGEDDETKHDSP